ncbi:hypothetical protein [Gephyromycinifex aptenodytis]|uniref:hypothetical protein n=1 Tax=Gephyromycinifex aptenodytis TaxID=2716227 RepID=UPI0014477936|nr:hypothetical protein [Gephyromycinifex aptenodytis]
MTTTFTQPHGPAVVCRAPAPTALPVPAAQMLAPTLQNPAPSVVGAHREPGSTPWRTGLREIIWFLSFGTLRLWESPARG